MLHVMYDTLSAKTTEIFQILRRKTHTQKKIVVFRATKTLSLTVKYDGRYCVLYCTVYIMHIRKELSTMGLFEYSEAREMLIFT